MRKKTILFCDIANLEKGLKYSYDLEQVNELLRGGTFVYLCGMVKWEHYFLTNWFIALHVVVLR